MAKKPASYLGGAVLIGTAIGAVVGMLAAPLSGKEMRGVLRRRAGDVGRELPERMKDIPARMKQLPDAVKELPARMKDLPARMKGLPAHLKDMPGRLTRRRRRPGDPIDTTATEVRPDDAGTADASTLAPDVSAAGPEAGRPAE